MDIQKYIKELLYTHDCIILPEFGGFISQYVPAEIHPINNRFLPPTKTIAFNQQLNVNDGLLISYIGEQNKKSLDESLNLVREFVAGIKNHIATFNLYVIKDVGRFFYNSQQQLEFEPENSINYLDDSFGLIELYSKPIERNFSDMSKIPPRIVKPLKSKAISKRNTQPKPSIEDEKFLIDVDGETEKKSFSLLYLIPLIIIIGSMGLLYYINHTGKSLASIFPGSRKNIVEINVKEKKESKRLVEAKEQLISEETYQPLENEIAISEKPIENSAFDDIKKDDNKSSENIISKKEQIVNIVNNPKDNSLHYNLVSGKSGKFFIIVGSFAEKKNALKLNKKIIKNGGIPAIIAPDNSNKFYKVAVEDFTELNTAIAKLESYKPRFGDGVWVMAY